MKIYRLLFSLRACAFLGAALLLLGSVGARANIILIDLGPSTGTGTVGPTASPDTNGNYWNNLTVINTTSPLSLVDTTNASTGISIDGSGWNGPGTSGLSTGTGIYPATATNDYFYIPAGRTTDVLTLSGMDPSKLYTFTFLSSRNATGNGPLTLTFTGLNGATVSGTDPNAVGGVANSTPFTTGALAPTASGIITVVGTTDGTDQADFNVLEIDVVPEPSTVALALVGGLGLLFAALRRKQVRI